jgi:ElaB/YqjD/DUF883 family membrane-anchored ribosome-binding protein
MANYKERTMDNLSNQENIGQTDLSGYESGTASGNESTIADKAYRAKDKVATQGRRAVEKVEASRRPTADALERAASGLHDSADRTSQKAAGVAHRAAEKLQATADYVRENDLRAMADDVVSVVNRYPRESVAVAVAVGFLVGRAFRSRD